MEIRSPGRNAIITTLTYAGAALAIAARDPNLGFYLVGAAGKGLKSFGRTGYNNKIVQSTASKNTIAEA